MALITKEELKEYPLPVTDKQWFKITDPQLDIVIGYASDHLEDYMDRRVAITNYIERIRRPSGTEYQMLGVYPLTTLNSVKSYDGLNNETVWDVSGFIVNTEAAILEWANRDRYAFGKHLRWVFDYDAGFATVPGPIKHATALQTVKMLQPIFRGGASFTETELVDGLDEQIIELLDYYKRRRIG